MKKTSIAMDDNTRKKVDAYCSETGSQLSEAIRGFIKTGIELYEKEKELGYKDPIGPNGLMVNQKYAIRASIEGTLILRKLAESLLSGEAVTTEVDSEVSKIMANGWLYDNNS